MGKHNKEKKDVIEIFGVKYLSAEYISNLLGGISTQSINNWALKGKITATKIGRAWYFTEENVKDYLSEMTRIGVAS